MSIELRLFENYMRFGQNKQKMGLRKKTISLYIGIRYADTILCILKSDIK